jgi:hypothetical protein
MHVAGLFNASRPATGKPVNREKYLTTGFGSGAGSTSVSSVILPLAASANTKVDTTPDATITTEQGTTISKNR